MPRTLTIFLATSPYSSENTATALKLASAALDKGAEVNLFASGDGVYNFSRGQEASGLPNPERGFQELMQRGLHVELCGSCLRLRGIEETDILDGADPSSMKRLFEMIGRSNAFITLG